MQPINLDRFNLTRTDQMGSSCGLIGLNELWRKRKNEASLLEPTHELWDKYSVNSQYFNSEPSIAPPAYSIRALVEPQLIDGLIGHHSVRADWSWNNSYFWSQLKTQLIEGWQKKTKTCCPPKKKKKKEKKHLRRSFKSFLSCRNIHLW